MIRAAFASSSLLSGLFASQLAATACLPVVDSCSSLISKRWATKKAGGSVKNSKDSHPKHLGVKLNEGQLVFPGQIILRQRGTRFHPGQNVCMGKDHTIHSKVVGFVKFSEVSFTRLNIFKRRRFAHVVPHSNHWELDESGSLQDMAADRTAIKQYISSQYRK